MINPLPDYRNLDLSGDVLAAALRMEARAREAASVEMFRQLITPLLTLQPQNILEFGCGTAALSRRIAQAAPQSTVIASDKSQGMLDYARSLIDPQVLPNLHLVQWDVLDQVEPPLQTTQFDLILSSVVLPYFNDDQTVLLVEKLASLLSKGGTLAFLEQDLSTDTVNFPQFEWFRDTLTRGMRPTKTTLALGLRPILRKAGLQVLPRRSFLWTDDAYGEYTRDLLERFADAACDRGQIHPAERDHWKATLAALAKSGDFYYGIVYHLIAGLSDQPDQR
jgi:ubiquinone/menaquinone biosynthesis C-methylase UbiE